MSVITTKSILDLYFKLHSYSNTYENWSKKHFSYNDFLLLSFVKLEVLCTAFNIGKCKNIQNAKFITKSNLKDYNALLSKINSEFKEKEWFEVEKLDFTKENIIYTFQKLWNLQKNQTQAIL